MAPDVEAVVAFLERAFDATETFRTVGGAGGTHVEVQIGDSMLMIGGGNNTVTTTTSASFFLYVQDVDAVYHSAVDAGADSYIEPANGLFTEQRGAGVTDPFGNRWFFAHH